MTARNSPAVRRAGTDLDLDGRGVAYVRVSGDKQEDDRQREAINLWATRHETAIGKWYADTEGKNARDQSAKRAEFQRLMRDVEAGGIRWIVVDDQDRFGTADPDEWGHFRWQLRRANCRLYDVSDRHLTDPGFAAVIQTGAKAETSRQEQRDKAKRVANGKALRAKLGEWQGGCPPYGMDVVCFDRQERERWRVIFEAKPNRVTEEIEQPDGSKKTVKRWNWLRVKVSPDGRRERFDGPRMMPAAEQADRLELRPSLLADRLAIVVDVFRWYVEQATNPSQIAARLNAAGIPAVNAGKWEDDHVRAILDNPIYIGCQRWNRQRIGRFYEIIKGEAKPVETRGGNRDAEDWVLSPELFPPVVDADMFQNAARKLAEAQSKSKPRAPKSADLWLSGLLHCQACGHPMRGHMMPSGTGDKRRFKPVYVCSGWSRKLPGCQCKRNGVSHERIEAEIVRRLSAVGELDATLNPKRSGNLSPAMIRAAIETIKAMEAMRRRVGIDEEEVGPVAWAKVGANSGSEFFDRLVSVYQDAHDRDAPAVRSKLDALKADHATLSKNLLRLPDSAKRAIAAAQAELVELERQIDEAEGKLTNAADQLRQSMEVVRDEYIAYREAEDAIIGGAGSRKKAEKLRAIVKRIDLVFADTGRAYGGSQLADIVYVPHDDYPNADGWTRSGSCSTRSGRGGSSRCCTSTASCSPAST
jgi:DNA invertase Pin-like site-specific DNA recombinase